MKIKTLTFSTFCAAFSVALTAGLTTIAHADLSYTYAEATHQIYSEGDTSVWELKGSYQINDQFFVSMEDSNLLNARSASVGIIVPLQQENLNVYAQLGLGNSGDDMYTIIEAGVRMAVTDEVEARVAVRLEPEAYPNDGETLIIGEALYHVTEKVAFVAGLQLPSEADGQVIRLGARIHFD